MRARWWVVVALIDSSSGGAQAAQCLPTGFFLDGINLTAARINAPAVTGEVDATGCNIGVFYDSGSGVVAQAIIHGANYFGVAVVAESGKLAVDVIDSNLYDIGEQPFNGMQHGVAVYYRAFRGSASGRIVNNAISDYQKGGIVLHGAGADVRIVDNLVTGSGPLGFIAQNGIQISWGARAYVEGNEVTRHEFTGSSTIATGILVVGGPAFHCPTVDGLCAYTTHTKLLGNLVIDNDVGIFLSNYDVGFRPPAVATNVQVTANAIAKNDGFTNGLGYQAGISIAGNHDKIMNNTITGSGYQAPGMAVDADPSFALRARLHANSIP